MEKGRAAVRIRGLVKTYATERGERVRVFSGLDLLVEEGELLSILGPTGCGKTTLLRILAGFEDWDEGVVEVGGKRPRPGEVPFALVFQQNTLFPWRKVLSNVALPLELRGISGKAARARARELLALVGLEGVERAYPYELSGGMQQRASLARALAQETAGLLMDEPFGALDDRTRRDLQEVLVRLQGERGGTVLFVTHNIEEALFLGDRVVILGRGGVLQEEKISLPRPRDPLSPGFTKAFTRLRRSFQELAL